MTNKGWVPSFKKIARVVIDILLFSFSLIIAYKLRLEHNVSSNIQNWYWALQLPSVIGFVVGLRMVSLLIFQVYSKMWRYTEVNEIIELAKPIAFSSIILAIPRIIGFSPKEYIFAIPISVIIIDSSISLILLTMARLLRKWQITNRSIKKRQKSFLNNKPKKRTLLIGAGEAAQELARKILQHPELEIEIICALDDAQIKQNIKITSKVKVVGQIKDLSKKITEYNIEQAIIAIPSLPPKRLREIIELCQSQSQSTKLEINIIPGVDQLASGQVTIDQFKKVSLEDLLGREPVDLSIPEVAKFINNKTILISGAGGSIGTELTKQLIKNFTPKRIYILGRGENSIFHLCQELNTISMFKKVEFSPIICDLRNYNQLYNQLTKANPDVIFHAAAHKHVPLMEDHPQEAFENNVIGTKNIAQIAGLLNTETFVNISTDKAVNPVSIMGCTKRLSELAVNYYGKEFPKTKYISVRFGNVLGSRGSVIPTWQYQLKNNLPLTVTSKDTFRFFMTIEEAASLVIKASAIGNPSEIMVLDMGHEINIYQLAKDFIRLSGFDETQVKINLTGLRPGEKLKEELVGYYEDTNATKHKKILVIQSSKTQPGISTINSTIDELCKLASTQEDNIFKTKLLSSVQSLNQLEEKNIPVVV